MHRLIALVLAALCCIPVAAHADQFRPAYLQIDQAGHDEYDLTWKLPAPGEASPPAIRPLPPRGTLVLSPVRSKYIDGALLSSWRIRVPGGIEGKAVWFPNLSASGLEVLIRFRRANGGEQVGRATAAAPMFVIAASPRSRSVAIAYAGMGIGHILGSFDHLLFVLALVILVDGWRKLAVTVTSFTLAHTLTLALATLGVIAVPGPPVEAAIALSIVFVAAEALQKLRGTASLASRKPWLVAVSFGLLHGLGFAGALAQTGLPEGAIPLGLLSFNIGVEIGQAMFIACALLLGWACTRLIASKARRQALLTAATYAIGGVASFWLFERVDAFQLS